MAAGDGVRIPGWLVAAILAIAGVVTASVRATNWVAAQTTRITDLEKAKIDENLRWCRLERAVKLEPWHTCPPEPPQ